MTKFLKKPIAIEAVRWRNDTDSLEKIVALGCKSLSFAADGTDDLIIKTLEGDMRAQLGDWVIRGIAGEFYPCKSDIFDQTYELPNTSGPAREGGTPSEDVVEQLCARLEGAYSTVFERSLAKQAAATLRSLNFLRKVNRIAVQRAEMAEQAETDLERELTACREELSEAKEERDEWKHQAQEVLLPALTRAQEWAPRALKAESRLAQRESSDGLAEEVRRAKIEALRSLGENWDSYGCEAFSKESVDAALSLEPNIPADFDSICPIAGGGVMFGKNGDEITIEVYADAALKSQTKEGSGG